MWEGVVNRLTVTRGRSLAEQAAYTQGGGAVHVNTLLLVCCVPRSRSAGAPPAHVWKLGGKLGRWGAGILGAARLRSAFPY